MFTFSLESGVFTTRQLCYGEGKQSGKCQDLLDCLEEILKTLLGSKEEDGTELGLNGLIAENDKKPNYSTLSWSILVLTSPWLEELRCPQPEETSYSGLSLDQHGVGERGLNLEL